MSQPIDRFVSFSERFSLGARRCVVAGAMMLLLGATGGALVAAAQGQDAAEKTVWDGVFAEEQATRGALVFSNNCSRCHGDELQGANATALVGDAFWQDFQSRTVEDLLTFITENMPNGNGGSLPAATYLDLAAFILSRNEFPAGPAPLTADSGVGVSIIPKGGATELPASTLARVVGCLAKGGDSGWTVTNATAPARVDSATVDPADATVALGDRSFQLLFVLEPLDNFVGHRVWVRGLLVGEGGADGVNVTQVESLSDSCD